MMYNLTRKRVWIAGHNGMVGSAVRRRLAEENCDVIFADRNTVDLTNQSSVDVWIKREKPDVIVLAAAKVGGIQANDSMPAEFIRDNLAIQTNVIHSAWKNEVEKLLFLGSSCIYPKHAAQPISEKELLTGPLEETNQWYAIAKISGIKMCQAYRKQYGADFISAQPTNLYGPGDNYDLQNSHVLPALIRKFHTALTEKSETVTIWGTGLPRREFLHVDDLADALVFLIKNYSDPTPINVGSGVDVTISELAAIIAKIVGYKGQLIFDTEKPDGTMRKLMDSSRLHALGWNRSRLLNDGIQSTYNLYLDAQ